jgi:hypothetical protein
MKRRIMEFFYGRNGFDTIAKVSMILSVILALCSNFVPIEALRSILYAIALGGLFYSYYRAFSRNLVKMRKENSAFLEYFKVKKLSFKERKQYKYFRCPKCKAWQRVPRGRGKIVVHCRACAYKFDKKS